MTDATEALDWTVMVQVSPEEWYRIEKPATTEELAVAETVAAMAQHGHPVLATYVCPRELACPACGFDITAPGVHADDDLCTG